MGLSKRSGECYTPDWYGHFKQKIQQVCGAVTQEMIRAACTRNLVRRLECCVNAGGHEFQHTLE